MSVYQSAPTPEQAAITAKDFNFWYGDFHALTGLDLNIAKNAITSFIGPSGCGKSTFLRCINRMNDLIEGTRVEGTMTLDGNDIYAEGVDPVDLRRRVGMIFQQPNPFPKSIYENVAFGPRLQGVTSKSDLDDIVEESLKRANLWKEVSNQLNKDGLALSGGQQQRLCIARVLAVQPDVLLMDEPCSAIDPTSVSKVEDLMARAGARDDDHHRHAFYASRPLALATTPHFSCRKLPVSPPRSSSMVKPTRSSPARWIRGRKTISPAALADRCD